MNPQDENQDTTFQTSAYNPFPEPQTIPSGWDLSGLTCTPKTNSETDETDHAENHLKGIQGSR